MEYLGRFPLLRVAGQGRCNIAKIMVRNIAEICFVCTAVVLKQPLLAKTALIGSVLSSCLMTFGTCLLSGGVATERLFYPIVVARANAQLLVVSLVSITLPTAFQSFSIGRHAHLYRF